MIKCPECGEEVPREEICANCGCCLGCCECEFDPDDEDDVEVGVLEAT